MSVREYPPKSGKHVVRWVDDLQVNRSKTFTGPNAKKRAQAWDLHVRVLRQSGALEDLRRGDQRLSEYVPEYWRRHAVTRLEPRTAENYAFVYHLHIAPHLGNHRLKHLTPQQIDGWAAGLLEAGTGRPTVLRAMNILSGILRLAVRDGLMDRNPVTDVPPPGRPGRESVRPLPPEHVEAVRALLNAHGAMLVSLLAYAGLRPQEALALRWASVGDNVLTVDGKNVDGHRLKSTKTRRNRTVRLLDPLAHDLRLWRVQSKHSRPDDPIIPGRDGQWMTDTAWRYWRRRHWNPAATKAGRPDATPYTLRHSFASLLLHEGQDVIRVAQQLGHSPTMTLGVYGHVIDELADAPRVPAGTLIQQARDAAGGLIERNLG